MPRLLEGPPQRTDGRLTKENLYKEAQISRATMNRALRRPRLLGRPHCHPHGKTTPGESQHAATIADLKKRLAAKTQECTLRQQLAKDVSTTVIPIRPAAVPRCPQP
ncbi:hypothetical protein ACODT3_39705 [Streptomyces sp. 4.24]|uniref:hypothetical protein n=1 Tax=Streptomyces tritrimontium TaxID=3406573 RepID=UPI003BB7360A